MYYELQSHVLFERFQTVPNCPLFINNLNESNEYFNTKCTQKRFEYSMKAEAFVIVACIKKITDKYANFVENCPALSMFWSI